MSKLDEIRKATSLGVRPGAFPPGTDPAQAVGKPARLEGVRGDRSAARIAIDRIVRDEDQPRTEFDPDALARLAESLKVRGQLQPIRVRWDEGRGAYVVLVGERRWRAAAMAGMAELLCVIEDRDLSADDRLTLQMVENALREGLTPIEQAHAYRRLIAANGWSGNRLAQELAIAQSSVASALALLDLPESVQDQVDAGELAPSVAYEISKLPDAVSQTEVAQAVVDGGMTRAEVSEVIRAVRAKRPAPAAKPEPITLDVGGVSVTVKWKRADGPELVKVLKLALKMAQDRRDEQAA